MISKVPISFLKTFPEFDEHQGFFRIEDPSIGLLAFIAIHRVLFGRPSFGATRYFEYESESEAIREVLSLSKMMTKKALISNLKVGGAKGVILHKRGQDKKRVLAEYALHLDQLKGIFVTGSDLGVTKEDVMLMDNKSEYIVGVKVSPEKFTAQGLFLSILECKDEFFKKRMINDVSFGIQGLGKVGLETLNLLYSQSKKIFVSDFNSKKTALVSLKYPKVIVIEPALIHKKELDFFIPCGLNNIVNSRTVNDFKCKIILGGANNQLESEDVGGKLFKKGIFFAPDYVVNAGGLISVVSEYEGVITEREIANKIKIIPLNLKKIIRKSKETKIPPNLVADLMVKNIYNEKPRE